MGDSYFFLKDDTYGLSSWTYDDGMFQYPKKVSLLPSDDIADDSQSYPADTPQDEEEEIKEEEIQEEEFQEEPVIPPLEAPPAIVLAPSFLAEVRPNYCGQKRPFTVLEALQDPHLREMYHPKDRFHPVALPRVEAPPINSNSFVLSS
jgi:hypothetical protein